MNYEITTEQLDRFLRSYFDKYFNQSVYANQKNEDGHFWTGYWLEQDGKKIILAGHPTSSNVGVWYYNGEILEGQLYFGLEIKDFIGAIKRYLNNVLGQNIKEVM